MGFLRTDKSFLHYRADGDAAKPALLLANSLGSDLRIWDDVAADLARDYYVIRYDLRGHGLSGAPAAPYSARELASDAVAVLDALHVSQAIAGGVSVGGLVAQALALHHGARVRGLVLSDTGARIATAQAWEQRIEKVRADGIESLVAVTMERWFSAGYRQSHAAAVDGYSLMLRQCSAEGYVGVCAALRDTDFRQAVSELRVPALILCGSADIATPPELGRELASLIAGARFELIDGAAHLPGVEQPGAVARVMRQFFQEVRFG